MIYAVSWLIPIAVAVGAISDISIHLPQVKEWYFHLPLIVLNTLLVRNGLRVIYGKSINIQSTIVTLTKEEWEKLRENENE